MESVLKVASRHVRTDKQYYEKEGCSAPSGRRDQGPILGVQAAIFETHHAGEGDERKGKHHKAFLPCSRCLFPK